MSGRQELARMLLLLVTVILLAGHGLAIIHTARKENLCQYCTCKDMEVICNCNNNQQNITIQKLDRYTTKLNINNCRNVILTRNSLADSVNLNIIQLSNIENLHLEELSLNWTYSQDMRENFLTINIRSCKIDEIQRFTVQGNIGEIHLEQVEINKVNSYAFSKLAKVLRLFEIKDSKIHSVANQAFKKFHTNNFKIINSYIEQLPSHSFLDIDVIENFIIENSTFDSVKSGAFSIKKPTNVMITKSHFRHLEGESFNISTAGNVQIRNNIIENMYGSAFRIASIKPESLHFEAQKLTFDNNTFNVLKINPLYFKKMDFQTKFGPILLNQTCTCLEIHAWITNNEWQEQVHCLIKSKYIRAKTFQSDNCDSTSNALTIVIAVIIPLVISIVLVGAALFFYKKYKERAQKQNVTEGKTENGMLGLIVPDGRTYRETELHVIIEKAELLTTEL